MGAHGISRRRRIFLAAVVAGIVLGGVVVRGGPPMLTDDPGTPGDKHWEIDPALTTVKAPDSRQSELPTLAVSYGIGDRFQLNYQVGWLVLQEAGASTRSGMSNSVAGFKYRFYDAGEAGWQIAAAPEVEFGTPGSNSADRGLVQRGHGIGMPLLFQKGLGDWTLNISTGYFYHSEGDDEVDYGISIGRDLKPGVRFIGEIFGNTSERFDGGAVAINFGASIDVGKNNSFQISLGRELANTDGERATLLAYVGWQIRL